MPAILIKTLLTDLLSTLMFRSLICTMCGGESGFLSYCAADAIHTDTVAFKNAS